MDTRLLWATGQYSWIHFFAAISSGTMLNYELVAEIMTPWAH